MYVHDAVMRSAENGHAEVLRRVVQHADPSRIDVCTLALWGALVHNHPQCVEVLFDWSNTDDVLRLAHERGAKPNGAWEVFEQKIAARQHSLLVEKVGYIRDVRGMRKI